MGKFQRSFDEWWRVVIAITVSLTLGLRVSVTLWIIPTWKWSQWPGLNRRPTVYETVALPLSYIGLKLLKIKLLRYYLHRLLMCFHTQFVYGVFFSYENNITITD